jgi:hypothetical protein
MSDLTPDQKAEVERLVAQGVPHDQAASMATEIQLDVPIGKDGRPTYTFEERLAEIEANLAAPPEESKDESAGGG